ncbi:hypothetical protein RTBOTA2_006721 [Rhodotorula toruloides]|nr:hypothetical protein RTBOTA2_006721 [Rhodotorula toruloides]
MAVGCESARVQQPTFLLLPSIRTAPRSSARKLSPPPSSRNIQHGVLTPSGLALPRHAPQDSSIRSTRRPAARLDSALQSRRRTALVVTSCDVVEALPDRPSALARHFARSAFLASPALIKCPSSYFRHLRNLRRPLALLLSLPPYYTTWRHRQISRLGLSDLDLLALYTIRTLMHRVAALAVPSLRRLPSPLQRILAEPSEPSSPSPFFHPDDLCIEFNDLLDTAFENAHTQFLDILRQEKMLDAYRSRPLQHPSLHDLYMEWSLSRFDPQAPGALEIAEKISRLRGFSRDGTLTPPPILHARLLGAAPLSPIVVPDSAESVDPTKSVNPYSPPLPFEFPPLINIFASPSPSSASSVSEPLINASARMSIAPARSPTPKLVIDLDSGNESDDEMVPDEEEGPMAPASTPCSQRTVDPRLCRRRSRKSRHLSSPKARPRRPFSRELNQLGPIITPSVARRAKWLGDYRTWTLSQRRDLRRRLIVRDSQLSNKLLLISDLLLVVSSPLSYSLLFLFAFKSSTSSPTPPSSLILNLLIHNAANTTTSLQPPRHTLSASPLARDPPLTFTDNIHVGSRASRLRISDPRLVLDLSPTHTLLELRLRRPFFLGLEMRTSLRPSSDF